MRTAPVVRGTRGLMAAGILSLCLSGCSLGTFGNENLSAQGASASVSEREHQDAQVLATVTRADLQELQSMGPTCESTIADPKNATTVCYDEVRRAETDISTTLSDINQMRVPAYMKKDTDALISALDRAKKACPAVLANAPTRIPEAYAANEFDVSIQHVTTALSKLSQDSN